MPVTGLPRIYEVTAPRLAVSSLPPLSNPDIPVSYLQDIIYHDLEALSIAHGQAPRSGSGYPSSDGLAYIASIDTLNQTATRAGPWAFNAPALFDEYKVRRLVSPGPATTTSGECSRAVPPWGTDRGRLDTVPYEYQFNGQRLVASAGVHYYSDGKSYGRPGDPDTLGEKGWPTP